LQTKTALFTLHNNGFYIAKSIAMLYIIDKRLDKKTVYNLYLQGLCPHIYL